MSHTTVIIPKVGVVAFPNSMDAKAINDTVRSLHQKAVVKSVLKFVSRDPALTGLDPAKFYQQLSTIAAFLEKYPSLARAADAGIHGEKVHDLPTVDEHLNAPVEPEQAEPTTPPPDSPEAEAEEPPTEETEPTK
jgi:hypothetical protein